jgi:transposase
VEARSRLAQAPCATGARHLGEALDAGRRSEYHLLAAKDRAFIKGQRDTLLSHREHLFLDGRRSLTKLLKANTRLNTAYLLKESSGQLWDCQTKSGARAFFTRWKQRLTWQRLMSYETCAAMIDRHGDGIASYCHPENKVSLGLVEGLNNKIHVSSSVGPTAIVMRTTSNSKSSRPSCLR